ncbi:bifunctional riboflavin kinase/FAD synthetase [uncultured Flavobacterium sp.]|uniref:bifunctional riboflavin kinase/FAD synthetase n=1 Tax=uncultured Flavobacterium sp. TaxID=165435 RepID=UPI0030EE7D25
MNTYQSIFDYNKNKKSILTLGTFDGVHIGHQKILQKLVKQANANGLESILLTFFPHPRMVLKQDEKIQLLNTIEEKSKLIEETGVDNLIIHPFDSTFSELSAEEFVKKILIDKLNLAKIIIGYDHKFGKNRSADINDLIILGKKYNFEVEQISAKEIDDISISSTKIRKALLNGNIELVTSYLGHNYSFFGTIVEGKKIGRTINYPTANLQISEDYKLIPKNGVYVVSSNIDNKTIFGMMNIGNNPTVHGDSESIEIHFFNFNEDIYTKKICVNLLSRIRDEQKFDSLNELKKQLDLDKKYSENYILENV